jgi:hypothetical protein
LPNQVKSLDSRDILSTTGTGRSLSIGKNHQKPQCFQHSGDWHAECIHRTVKDAPMSTSLPPESALAVLRYFLRHPDAADSLAGIVKWRLLEGGIEVPMEKAGVGVDWLVGHGYLLRSDTASAGAVFRLNPANREQAWRLTE